MKEVGRGYINKNKEMSMGKGPGNSNYEAPLFKGPLVIEGTTYYFDIYPANGKWGKQDLFVRVKKELTSDNMEELIL